MTKNLRRVIFPILVLAATTSNSQISIGLELLANGFDNPVGIENAGDSRLFIVEQTGRIKIIHDDYSITTFLDIDAEVGSAGNEQGLLGLAFHPDYENNGYFYVNYTDNDGDTHIARFTRSAENPDSADLDSEVLILFLDQPAPNHNGGSIRFSPYDGYFYIFTGDGGGNSPNRAQDITDNLFGKVLRIDVDGGFPYAIPPDNPYVGIEGDDEIWAPGLRNPWRSTFDRLTGDMWIGDVGAQSWEEVDFVPAGAPPIYNFGWKCFEAYDVKFPGDCDAYLDELTWPVFYYSHTLDTGGRVVTGGYCYRGSDHPAWYGVYFLCDYIMGRFWTLVPDGAGGFDDTFHGFIKENITSFGEDQNGELFVCVNSTGEVFRMVDGCESLSATATVTDATASTMSNGGIDITVTGGTGPYTYLWSGGQTTEDISSLFAGDYSVTVTDANGCTFFLEAEVQNLCSAATGIVITPSATSAFIDWNDVGASGYKVLYKAAGPGAFSQVITPVSSVTLTGLNPSTNYMVSIKNKCTGAPGVFTSNSSFMTLPLKEINAADEEISIYPNPGQGKFFIDGIKEETELIIFDLSGNKIGEYYLTGNSEIDLSELQNGIYILKFINSNNLMKVERLIISG